MVRGASPLVAALGAAAVLALPSCATKTDAPAPKAAQLTIGLSLDTVREERWQRDRDEFVKHAEELGAKVLVQVANNSDVLQNSQCENLLTQGAQVLVVAPHNSRSAATIVETAHRAHVPVIAYDRLIENADVDLYMSFDNLQVGVMQAEYAVQKVPKGNYLLIAGAPTDNNAHLYRTGQLQVLEPYVDRGDIKIVADPWANDWQPREALQLTENALTRNQNKIDAVVVSNDGLAGGTIQALAEQKLAGKVLVTGQDAELSACQRILAGTQSMTVYKPIKALASRAAEVAIGLAKREPMPATTGTLPNGFKDVPCLLIPPIAVDKDNMATTVVADGFHKLEDVYRDVPREQWPTP